MERDGTAIKRVLNWGERLAGAARDLPVPPLSPRIGRPTPVPVIATMPIALTTCERRQLKKMAYGHKTPYQARQRAAIVLLAARGRSNARIASETRMHVDTARNLRPS